MLSFFDYVFYRAYKLGVGRAKSPLAYASMIVSVMQSLIIICLLSIIDFYTNYTHPDVWIYILVILTCYIINYYRYESNPWIDKMDEMWGGETENRKVTRGWLIVLLMAALVSAPLTFAKMGYKYKHKQTTQGGHKWGSYKTHN